MNERRHLDNSIFGAVAAVVGLFIPGNLGLIVTAWGITMALVGVWRFTFEEMDAH